MNFHLQPTKSKGNWFDSLLVAADHLKNGVPATKIAQKKIILMTNFKVPSDMEESQVKMVCTISSRYSYWNTTLL